MMGSVPPPQRNLMGVVNLNPLPPPVDPLYLKGMLPPLPGIPRRAGGGPVRKKQPYWVGEKGPELVVPKEDGEVIPNHHIMTADEYYKHRAPAAVTGLDDITASQAYRSPAYARVIRARELAKAARAGIPAGGADQGISSWFGGSTAPKGGSTAPKQSGIDPQSTELANAESTFIVDPLAGTHSWDDRLAKESRKRMMGNVHEYNASHGIGASAASYGADPSSGEEWGAPPITNEQSMNPNTMSHGMTPYGSVSNAPAPHSIEGLDPQEWFQRKANANGVNRFASPESGYQGIKYDGPVFPITPLSKPKRKRK